MFCARKQTETKNGARVSERRVNSSGDRDDPVQLDTKEYPHTIEIQKDKLTTKYVGMGNHCHDVGSVRTDLPVPRGVQIYYFEVEVLDAGTRGSITVGLGPRSFPLTTQVGTGHGSVGFRGDDGKKYRGSSEGASSGACYGPFFGTGDVVGCGISFHNNTVFYTKNGRSLGTAFSGVRGELYPTVSLHSPGERVRVNLGADEFQYDIEGYRADERAKRELEIHSTKISTACLAPLVRSYLHHASYMRTLEAFDAAQGCVDDAKEEHASDEAGSNGVGAPDAKRPVKKPRKKKQKRERRSTTSSASGDGSASSSGLAARGFCTKRSRLDRRDEIRKRIMSGDVEGARGILQKEFPNALDARLRARLDCQRFVELVRAGDSHDAIAFARSALSRHTGLSSECAQLRCDVMGMVAYTDPAKSPLAYLLKPAQREQVADLANANIMHSLGLPQRSKLESLLRQLLTTEEALREHNDMMGVPFALEGELASA